MCGEHDAGLEIIRLRAHCLIQRRRKVWFSAQRLIPVAGRASELTYDHLVLKPLKTVPFVDCDAGANAPFFGALDRSERGPPSLAFGAGRPAPESR